MVQGDRIVVAVSLAESISAGTPQAFAVPASFIAMAASGAAAVITGTAE
jgi:hypothetical protein